MGVEDELVSRIVIAVSEACSNAVVHGYRDRAIPGSFEVAAHRSDLELFIRVSDDGCGMTSRSDSAGRGLALVETLTTRMDVGAADDGHGTVVSMTFDAVAPDVDAAQAAPRAGRVGLSGDALLAEVTTAMVALHLRHHHRVPTTAKTQLLGGELLACTLEGIYTDVEKTMIELQNYDVVERTRLTFQTAMRHRFIESVERLSGREVTSFVSNLHVGPDMAVELFMLGPERDRRVATAGLGDSGTQRSAPVPQAGGGVAG